MSCGNKRPIANIGAHRHPRSAAQETPSGKVVRGTMQKIADAEPFQVPATIDDASVLDDVRRALQTLGYAREAGAAIDD